MDRADRNRGSLSPLSSSSIYCRVPPSRFRRFLSRVIQSDLPHFPISSKPHAAVPQNPVEPQQNVENHRCSLILHLACIHISAYHCRHRPPLHRSFLCFSITQPGQASPTNSNWNIYPPAGLNLVQPLSLPGTSSPLYSSSTSIRIPVAPHTKIFPLKMNRSRGAAGSKATTPFPYKQLAVLGQ